MRLYHVTYDHLVGGKYREQHTRLFAKNAKEACQAIKDNYWESLETEIQKGYSPSTARRNVRWPFHIRAERMD